MVPIARPAPIAAPIAVPIARPAVYQAPLPVDMRSAMQVEQARMKANAESIEQIGEMVRRLPISDGQKRAEATKSEVLRNAWNSNFQKTLEVQKEKIGTLQQKQAQ